MNFLALAQAPDLAKAARAELWNSESGGEPDDSTEEAPHAVELERQKAAIKAIDIDARAESAVNKVWLGTLEPYCCHDSKPCAIED